MEVVNDTMGFTISRDAELRDSFRGRFRGLMLSGRRDIVLAAKEDSIADSTIHMMFMLYPIDVLWVNENMEVVDLKRNVKPWTPMHKPKAPAKYVVELAVGDMKNTTPGDKIRFR